MARPRQYANAAERQAAFKVRQSNVTSNETPVTKPSNETPENLDAEDLPENLDAEDLDARPSSLAETPARHQPHVPLSLFDSVRRGTPRTHTDGHSYVLVARSAPTLSDGYAVDAFAVVPATDWHARLDQRCGHGYDGWTCHTC